MRRRVRSLLLCLVLLLPPGAAQAARQPSAEEELARMFHRYSTLGASVAVFQNGRITYTYTYGVASPGGPAITSGTAFQVGSISKMVGCIGLMQLLGAQSIPLDTELGGLLGYPVRSPYDPDVPVTLRQLMTHTAALRDGRDYDAALDGDARPLSELFGYRARNTFYDGAAPGTRRISCNFGGGLIGSLVEKLSGQTLDDYMEQNVFAPLGITAAYQPSRLPSGLPLADMYHMPQKRLAKRLADDASDVRLPDAERHYTFTAGKLVISAPDLCKLLIALCDGGIYENTRILTEGQTREMLTVQNHIGSVACESGNGLFINIITDDQVEGRTLYGHGGKANGMLCAAYFDPTDRTGVVMLTNGCQNRSARNGVGMLGRQILTICYDEIIGPAHQTENPFAVDEKTPDLAGSRDTCILQADESEDIFVAKLDLTMLRRYREEEIHGNAYRRPQKYGALCEDRIAYPFERLDRRVLK